MPEHILALDCGTTASKVALFDLEGRMVAISTQEYELLTPTALVVELPAERFWQAFVDGAKDVLARSGVDPRSVIAFSLSAQGETFVVVDQAGHPLRNAISWMDNRAQEEAEVLSAEFGDVVYRITGQVSVAPTWPASKLLWIRRHEPDVFRQIDKVLLIEDYLLWRLTGSLVCEGSLICSTLYWNITTEQWWDDMLNHLGLTSRQLPEIRRSGSPIGVIKSEVAQELGLGDNVVVAMGALDQVCGSIGVGNVRSGIFSENTGAALAICVLQEDGPPVFDPSGVMPVHYHGIPGRYMFHTFTSGGIVLRWYRDKFCTDELHEAERRGLDAYELITALAREVPPGSDGLITLPHLQGAMAPEDNPLAKGVFFGFTLSHGKAHFARSIMESIGFIIRRNLDVIESMGIEVSEIRVLGGGARSDLWNQIKADVTGKRIVKTANEEAACLGAAILAGKGAGVFGSIEEAADRMSTVEAVYEPQSASARAYSNAYATYVQLYENLLGVFARSPQARDQS